MITLYENARIFTADDHARAEAFVTQDDRFVFAGSAKEAHSAYPDARIVDLGGLFVCPGFNDSHMHLLELGCVLTQAQLGKPSLSAVLEEVASFAASHPQEAFILGRGFNNDHFTDENRFPTRDDLDAVCPDKPCLITRVCGHIAVANSRALALAGIDRSARPVEGGCIYTNGEGRPTGVLSENAIFLISSIVPKPDRAAIKERLLLAMECVHSYGITSVQTDDFCALDVPFEEIIGAYLELKAEGRLTVRVTEQCLLPTLPALERFLAAGYNTGWGNEHFRIGPLKLLADGSLGARTAYLRAPYTDAPDTSGIACYTQEELDALVLRAQQAGMQAAIHCIGDGASDMALHAFENAQSLCPRENMRHGIVHTQLVDHKQALRMKQLGLHAYIQSIFLDYDTQIVESRIGARAQEAYPAASLLRLGATLSNGSDSPVEPPNVLAGIQCAVTRSAYTRRGEAPYLPHEALTLSDALRSFTFFGAYASFEEEKKGRIAPGYLADFTVLGIDPFETDPAWIHKIPVLGVYISGKKLP